MLVLILLAIVGLPGALSLPMVHPTPQQAYHPAPPQQRPTGSINHFHDNGGSGHLSGTNLPQLPALVVVGPPEQMGGPTGELYDSPFTAVSLPALPLGSTEAVAGTRDPHATVPSIFHRQVGGADDGGTIRGYSANSVSQLVVEGPSLSNLLTPNHSRTVGLGRNPDKTALDHCGAWLNVALADASLVGRGAGGAAVATASSVVRGFYHQETGCDYARGFYTNKSIGFALSVDGGRNFTKQGAIITAPLGNTTTAHQTGEGDHGVAVVGESMYLYFTEWDPPAWSQGKVTIGLAASPVGRGEPGSWKKYFDSAFTEPGLRGRSAAIAGITGTAVRPLAVPICGASLVSVGNRMTWPAHSLGFSADGINWVHMEAPLMPLLDFTWNRSSAAVGELHAYPSLLGASAGARLGSGGEQVYLYYTYLEPGATFASRYMVRRPVRMLSTDYRDGVAAGCGGDANGSNVLLSLTPYTNGRDHWMTTAMVPVARGYRPTGLRPLAVELGSDSTGGGGVYVNTRQSSPLQHAIYDCYITQWKDHMVALVGECGDGISSRVLRLLGWVYTHAPSVGAGARPLWRCFNNATSDHATSLTGDCAHDVGPGYHTEFILGYVTVLPQSVSA